MPGPELLSLPVVPVAFVCLPQLRAIGGASSGGGGARKVVGPQGRGWGTVLGPGRAGSVCQARRARVGRVGGQAPPPPGPSLLPRTPHAVQLSSLHPLLAFRGSFTASLCRSCCSCASFLSRVGTPMRHPLSRALGPALVLLDPASLVAWPAVPPHALLCSASTLPPWAREGRRLNPQAVRVSPGAEASAIPEAST